MDNKLPPQELETEESIIASILTNDQAFKTCDQLNPHEFYRTDHQNIFAVMKNLYLKKERIDLTTVGAVLLKQKKKPLIIKMTRLCDTAPLALNLKTHAKIIRSAAIKRNLLTSIAQIKDQVYQSKAEDVVDFAQSEIMKYKIGNSSKIYHIKEIVMEQIEEIEKNNTVEKRSKVKLGFQTLDKWISLNDGTYIVVAGRPSMGKTAFALTCIKNMALSGQKPGIISLEMGKGRLINRWLSMETGINTMLFNRYHGLNKQAFESVSDSANMMYEYWDVVVADAPAKSIETIERYARRMVSDGVDAIFIDQLSKIGGRSDDDFKNYTLHSNRIARLATELKIPIFLLAQLNRKLEDRHDKEPRLSDLKMTGSLEEDADIVMMLHRPEYYEQDQEKKKRKANDVVLNIAKNRDGITYKESDVIVFDKKRTIFLEDFSRIARG